MVTKARTLYNSIVSLLENAGIEDPHLEAEVLLKWAFSTDRTGLYTGGYVFEKNHLKRLRDTLKKRLKRLPVQYLTGRVEFYGYEFFCEPGVFIPRQETEKVVDVAVDLIKERRGPLVLDICTGTGAIGLSIAKEVPDSHVVCSDIDPKALSVAERNSKALKVEDRVSFYLSDLFDDLPENRYDMIVCNPPYIPSELTETLQPEITLYEPRRALDGGPDGLKFYRKILGSARNFLKPDGYILFEVGIGQHKQVCEIAEVLKYNYVKTVKDLIGIERVVVFQN